MRLHRPYGAVIGGELVLGVELLIQGDVIEEIRPHTGIPDSYILSPAFVNAHSHFEYRGMQGQISEPRYFEWIWELTKRKTEETPEFVEEMCDLAAQENRATGIAWVGEHSDRPGSAKAMVKHGLGGWVFQELLDFVDPDPAEKLALVATRRDENAKHFPSISINPHAYHTVSAYGHAAARDLGEPLSVHVAETPLEDEFVRFGRGQIADLRRARGLTADGSGLGVIESMDKMGLFSSQTQCVHVCSVSQDEIKVLASRGATVAHCPQSNVRLQCPPAPIREMLDAGITVGLGLDSPASGGPINMFAEMRAALDVAYGRGKPLHPAEVFRMATSMGYRSFGKPKAETWDIYEGSSTPLLEIHLAGARDIEHVIEHASPADVRWFTAS